MSRSRSRKRAGDYEVGYGRPPVAGRFKVGNVGNPKGRPKKKKTVGQLIEEGMLTRIVLEENGRSRTVTAQEIIILNLIRASARVDIRAIHALFALRDRYRDSKDTTMDPTDLESEDRKIIEEHLARLRASSTDVQTQAPDDATNHDENENKPADDTDGNTS